MGKFVIFDMDGVLVDSEPIHMELERLLFSQLNLQVPTALHHSFVGMAPKRVWETLIQQFELPHTVDELFQLEKEVKHAELQARQIQCIPAVDTLLATLKENGYNLSVASSSPHNIIALILEKLGFRHYFDFIVSSEDVRNGKPSPDIFLEVAQRYQEPAANFIVIEDSSNGVKGAKAAGMMCIGYKSANSGNQDLSLADLVTEDFSRLRLEDLEALRNNTRLS
ncbi:HAD family hydrolase [Pontibacter litorisediminis]|uniref:HAD family hydrolase n=1 Tax=Pontibacter litorisediminis TaxID=1846260 RepID=UPI0023EC63E9|nr:HAD family phosphatase [Pontibacter litorisediminis]